MFADVEMSTIAVFTVNVALVAPAGTNTLDGTLADPLLLESATIAPPAGAAALNFTVPVEASNPPTTLLGFKLSETTVGNGRGFTVRMVVLAVPP